MPSRTYAKMRESCELPSPAGVALQILELVKSDETTTAQIARVVDSDPAMASRILRLINSPMAGMSRRIASVERAIALIGRQETVRLVLGFSLLSNNRKGRCVGLDYDLFWSECLARAVTAKQLTAAIGRFSPDEAFTCALLCQIGRLGLATAFPEEYSEVLEVFAGDLDLTSTTPHGLADIERLHFGIDHNELAAEMMADWNLPPLFCDAVRNQAAPMAATSESIPRAEALANVLHVCSSFAQVITQPTVYRDGLAGLSDGVVAIGLSPEICGELFDRIRADWREAGSVFDLKTQEVPPLREIYAEAAASRARFQQRGPREGADAEVVQGGARVER